MQAQLLAGPAQLGQSGEAHGSTEAKPTNRPGNRATIPATRSLERGGRPVAVSASQASSTPTQSRASYTPASSSAVLRVTRRRK